MRACGSSGGAEAGRANCGSSGSQGILNGIQNNVLEATLCTRRARIAVQELLMNIQTCYKSGMFVRIW